MGSIFALVKETVEEFFGDNAPRMAAALSYYTIFSLPPLMIIVIWVAGLFMSGEAVQGRLVEQISRMVDPTVARAVGSMIRSAHGPGSGGLLATSFSLVGLLFGASNAFAQLQSALNQAWEVEKDPKRSGVVRFAFQRLLSFGMIVGVAILVMGLMVIGSVLSAARGTAAAVLPAGLDSVTAWALDLGVSVVVTMLLFMAIYKVIPDARVHWSDVWRGALAATILFIVGRFFISYYIGRANPGGAYGAAGSLAIILLWVYYSALIFLLGAEFTQVYARRRGHGIEPDEDAVRVVKRIERQEA